jgi:hypothetical protein
MEDASAVDLDWFWRGWFYDIEPVDIAIDTVKAYTLTKGTKVPVLFDTLYTFPKQKEFEFISRTRNRESGLTALIDTDTTLRDFYYHYKPKEITKEVKNRFNDIEPVSDTAMGKYADKFIYEIKFSNKGGLVMPLIIQFLYFDGTADTERIGAYIWRKNEKEVTKTFLLNKKVIGIVLDPLKETCDINEKNNVWNVKTEPSKFDLYKAKTVKTRGQSVGENPMQKAKGK